MPLDLDESKRIPELDSRLILLSNAKFAVYFPDTDITYQVPASSIVQEIGSSDDYAWNEITSYSEGQIVGHLGDLWVSDGDDNLGNAPGPASAFWTLGVPGASGIIPWVASIFTKQYIVTLYLNRIWFLNSVTRPYNSTDIAAEIAAGDWIELSADLISKEYDASGTDIDLDMVGVKEVVFTPSEDITESKTFDLLNISSAIKFELIGKFTTTDPQTFPAGSRMMNASDEWDDVTKIWTPVDPGTYKFKATKWGSDWLIEQFGPWLDIP
jgi:hypothetical protein